MKIKITALITLLLIYALSLNAQSCKAGFAYIISGDTITFTDTSLGAPTNWIWSFGDGDTSYLQNPPPHAYNFNGNHAICLTIYDSTSCYNTQCKTIYTGCIVQTVDFQHNNISGNLFHFTTGSGKSWSWNFGDGSTSALQNPNHTYTAPGIYCICLTAIDTSTYSCTNNTICKTIFVGLGTSNPWCTGNINRTNDTLNPNGVYFTSTFNQANPTNWLWSFGDGDTSSLDLNPHHIYASPGYYDVSLSTFDSFQNCMNTMTMKVVVGICKASFEWTIDSNYLATFTNTSLGNFPYWCWQYGTQPICDKNSSFQHVIPPDKSWSVCLSLYETNTHFVNKIPCSSYCYSGNFSASVNELTLNRTTLIYPNPFNKTATLEIKSFIGNKAIDLFIYNLMGQEVRHLPFSKQTTNQESIRFIIERGDLKDGIYFYKVKSESEIIGNGKLIIE